MGIFFVATSTGKIQNVLSLITQNCFMNNNSATSPISKSYLLIILLLMLILPLISLAVEFGFYHPEASLINMAGKWFLFWGIGVRLFTAGLKQASNPAFTAKTIFHIQSDDAFVIVRELGFANICLGAVAIVSLFSPSWRMAAAFTGGLYLGIAGLMHIVKKPVSGDEWVALVSDVFMFVVIGVYMINALL